MSQAGRTRGRGLVSLLSLALAVLLSPSWWPSLSAAAPAPALRLAVMEFATAGADPALTGMGPGLQSMIATDLASVGSLTLVERARLRDVVAELKLGRSRLVDAATAAKVGKVVGATHLLTGSVTIAGDKMRLDTRLVEVATGRVLLGESIDGETSLFFELEKTLVRKLVDAVAVQVTPRERGALAKIQTVDLEALRQYGTGLKLFDDKQYQQALTALRAASDRDVDFSLARTTLAEYERLVSELRQQADQLEQTQAMQQQRVLNQELTDEQKMIERLSAQAGKSGHAAAELRLAALFVLATRYNASERDGFQLAAHEDRFAWQRMTDAYYQRYLAESLAVFPAMPALVNQFDDRKSLDSFYPRNLPTFDQELARIAGALKTFGVDKEKDANILHHLRQRSLTVHRRENIERLRLDFRGGVELEERLDGLFAKTGDAKIDLLKAGGLERARLRRALLDFDGSTRLLVSLRTGQSDPATLRTLASEIQANAQLKALVEARPGDTLYRELIASWLLKEHEYAASRIASLAEQLRKAFTSDGALTNFGARELTGLRSYQNSGCPEKHLVVGDRVLYPVRGRFWMGARRDPCRSDEARYYQRGAAKRPAWLLIADGVPRRELKARFQLSLAHPADMKPDSSRGKLDAPAVPEATGGWPIATFVFGARDIDRMIVKEGNDGGKRHRAPLRALGIRLEATRMALVDVTGSDDADLWNVMLTSKVLGEHPFAQALAGPTVDVVVRVEDRKVVVTAGGESQEWPLPRGERGFYGFAVEGDGYLGLRKLDFTSAAATTVAR